MAEYIDRKAIFPNGVFFASEENPLASLDELIKRIWSIPKADVAPVRHGRWVLWNREFWIHQCSVCEHKPAFKTNYCPSCGAKMDLEG